MPCEMVAVAASCVPNAFALPINHFINSRMIISHLVTYQFINETMNRLQVQTEWWREDLDCDKGLTWPQLRCVGFFLQCQYLRLAKPGLTTTKGRTGQIIILPEWVLNPLSDEDAATRALNSLIVQICFQLERFATEESRMKVTAYSWANENVRARIVFFRK
eukprot:Gregarina_sp_Poly_1__7141@NODE_390_length_8980_cov_56_327724_g319_i0_p2_GENE_NODE_390_length_8980_cov_56_327724_g319_i0NODE_390_length_8980_cov_56_327724_g319_i0_p2_ORF_typecomplete_len162_score3_19_NODE_390_length_8980_cov_56_327724_g319_i015772062